MKTLTQDEIANKRKELIEANWNYRTATGKWAGGTNLFQICEGKELSVSGSSSTVWSSNGKWKGADAYFYFCIPKGFKVYWLGGLLTFTKGTKSFWVVQGRGFNLNLVEGYVFKNYHLEKSSTIKTYNDACLKISKMRQKRALELLKNRACKNINLNRVWVGIKDSLVSGNCAAGTENFVNNLKRKIGEIEGIRADFLLEIENSRFSNRAIVAAKMRYAAMMIKKGEVV